MSRLSGKGRSGVRDPEVRFQRATRWGRPSDHQPDLGPCLLYIGADNGNGYGQFSYGGKNGYAHRYAWERANGPIPGDLTVDHLCRVRNCVNVEHLELVSGAENYLRAVAVRDRCSSGHAYTPGNLIEKPDRPGVRFCRKCEEGTAKRGGLRRTNAYKGIEDQRIKYDGALRDRLVVEVVEGRMPVREAAEQVGCAPKYLDKLVRKEARARGIANRRDRKAPVTFNGWTEFKTRVAVRERSGGACERCDTAVATDMHHRKNRSQSGKWHPANIVHLCALCHVEVTAEPEKSRATGFSMRSMEEPETVPILIRGRRCLLEDDGTVVHIPGEVVA